MGYSRITKLAIYKFHKENDAGAARAHLLRTFQTAGLANARRVEEATATLNAYIAWMARSAPIVAEAMVRADLPLGHGMVLGGEVSRIDVLPEGGYRAILLDDKPRVGWRQQLRMPLLQRAVARRYRREEEDVCVGFQDLDGLNLTVTCYDTADMAEAAEEAKRIAAQVAATLP